MPSRAGVLPAQRALLREQCIGFADPGRRDACPTLVASRTQASVGTPIFIPPNLWHVRHLPPPLALASFVRETCP